MFVVTGGGIAGYSDLLPSMFSIKWELSSCLYHSRRNENPLHKLVFNENQLLLLFTFPAQLTRITIFGKTFILIFVSKKGSSFRQQQFSSWNRAASCLG